MTMARPRVAQLVVALWLASAVTLLGWQARQLGATPPEEPVAESVRRCQQFLGPGDVLGVVYLDSAPGQFLLAYRLAYRLYPAEVTTEPYLTIDEVPIVLQRMRERRPTYLLLLGAEDITVPDATLVDRPAPEARLFRMPTRTR
jgi:hypothetical protein